MDSITLLPPLLASLLHIAPALSLPANPRQRLTFEQQLLSFYHHSHLFAYISHCIVFRCHNKHEDHVRESKKYTPRYRFRRITYGVTAETTQEHLDRVSERFWRYRREVRRWDMEADMWRRRMEARETIYDGREMF